LAGKPGAKAAEEPAEQPIVIKNGTTAPLQAKPAAVDPAPAMTGIAAPAANGNLSNLMGNESAGPKPVLQAMTVSQGVSQGLITKRVQPVYPSTALRMRIEGSVQLLATISKTGNITSIKVESGEPLLTRAATDAVKQWKYKPYLLNGEPVEIQTQITVDFKLPK
jgi:periplasmic protein TonB